MFLTRWFPIILAVLQTARHLAFVGYDYWTVAQNEKHFDAGQFIRRDLTRPLFEPHGFCGAWTTYSAGQTVVLGLDLPAYIGATLLHSAMAAKPSCVDALTTPRCQIIVAVCVLPLWFLSE